MDKQINEMTDGGPVQDADLFVADRVASPWVTVKVTAQAIYDYVAGKLLSAGVLVPPSTAPADDGKVLTSRDGAAEWEAPAAPDPITYSQIRRHLVRVR